MSYELHELCLCHGASSFDFEHPFAKGFDGSPTMQVAWGLQEHLYQVILVEEMLLTERWDIEMDYCVGASLPVGLSRTEGTSLWRLATTEQSVGAVQENVLNISNTVCMCQHLVRLLD